MVNLFGLIFVLIFSQGVFAQGAALKYAAQGWTSLERQWFYSTTQGSQLLPYDWFLALERPNSQVLFLDDNLARFGYLPGEAQPAGKPKSLPVGFVADVGKKGWFVGMTCAACHTSEIKFGAETLRVDGAPTNADMFEFLKELGKALEKASTDDAAFQRFANRLPKSQAIQPSLRKTVADFSGRFTQFVSDSTPANPWGPARLDAFGMILNRITNIRLGNPSNNRVPNAPVSYPFLWGTGKHDVTQWNGLAPNKLELERLARNAGEVLGVFADFSFNKKTYPYAYYESSANRLNLLQLDRMVDKLKPPPWPEALAPTSVERINRGEAIYKSPRSRCIECHQITPGTDGKFAMKMVPVAEIGTDPAMAQTLATRTALTGRLAGERVLFVPFGDRLGAEDLASKVLKNAVGGALVAPLLPQTDIPWSLADWAFNYLGVLTYGDEIVGFLKSLSLTSLVQSSEEFFETLPGQIVTLLNSNAAKVGPAYKARPLEGIWATAPYLHNGSVPNLMELLTRPELRAPKFSVGSRKFDFANVGFASSLGSGSFEFDTSISGNRNIGHEYGTDLTFEEKKDLIEFLKKL